MKEQIHYWLVTDTHLGHQVLIDIGWRPENFESKIMNGIKNLEDGLLIHLGDICIGEDKEWNLALTTLPHSSVKKILVRGNHDTKSDTFYLKHGWDFVCESFVLEKYGKKILFTHVPVKDHVYDLNIHGHWHDNDHRWQPEFAEWYTQDKYYKLAIEETNYLPVSLLSIIHRKNATPVKN